MRYFAIPLELSEANALVAKWHRHHQPCQGHRFSRDVLEVVRLVTDGTENCCSILYAAAARAGKAMGFRRIQTYVLDSERGTSLVAAGWNDEGTAGGGQWVHTDGKARRTDQPTETKRRWAKSLADRPDLANLPDRATKRGEQAPDLFGGVA